MQTTHLNLDSLPTYREGTVSHAWEQYWNSAGLCWFCTKVFQPQEQIQTNQELLACHRLHQRWVGQSKVSIQFAAFQLQHAQQVQFQVVFIIQYHSVRLISISRKYLSFRRFSPCRHPKCYFPGYFPYLPPTQLRHACNAGQGLGWKSTSPRSLQWLYKIFKIFIQGTAIDLNLCENLTRSW